jgi:hypothetical protein
MVPFLTLYCNEVEEDEAYGSACGYTSRYCRLFGWLVGGVLNCIHLAAMRKASSAVKNQPLDLKRFLAPMPLAEVDTCVFHFAQQYGYHIDDLRLEEGRIILSDSATATSWGFFYPVYLTQETPTTTLVEVGIKSKFIQIGPIPSRHYEKCANGIYAAIYVHQPTVSAQNSFASRYHDVLS